MSAKFFTLGFLGAVRFHRSVYVFPSMTHNNVGTFFSGATSFVSKNKLTCSKYAAIVSLSG